LNSGGTGTAAGILIGRFGEWKSCKKIQQSRLEWRGLYSTAWMEIH
jgi:hypothetical protein